MRHVIDALNANPRYVSVLGTVTGWFTVEGLGRAITHALPVAQLFAVLVAGFVSVCSAVLIAPKTWEQLRAFSRSKPKRDR